MMMARSLKEGGGRMGGWIHRWMNGWMDGWRGVEEKENVYVISA